MKRQYYNESSDIKRIVESRYHLNNKPNTRYHLFENDVNLMRGGNGDRDLIKSEYDKIKKMLPDTFDPQLYNASYHPKPVPYNNILTRKYGNIFMLITTNYGINIKYRIADLTDIKQDTNADFDNNKAYIYDAFMGIDASNAYMNRLNILGKFKSLKLSDKDKNIDLDIKVNIILKKFAELLQEQLISIPKEVKQSDLSINIIELLSKIQNIYKTNQQTNIINKVIITDSTQCKQETDKYNSASNKDDKALLKECFEYCSLNQNDALCAAYNAADLKHVLHCQLDTPSPNEIKKNCETYCIPRIDREDKVCNKFWNVYCNDDALTIQSSKPCQRIKEAAEGWE